MINIKNIIKIIILVFFININNTQNAIASASADVRIMSQAATALTSHGVKCSAAEYRSMYTGECWSCFVIENLISAFLNAAKNGIPVTQNAGKILLVLGVALWIIKWGLDNVSSFSEIQSANILNTLFKMSFKVLLAYWFIIYSPSFISQYFIRPIMSVGAVIGQSLWAEEMKETATPWDDLSDVDITEAVNKSKEEQQKEKTSPTKDTDQETVTELNARINKDKASTSEIPPFQLPGTNGSISSFPGCRIPPPTNKQTNCGSFSHMGLDILASAGSPIWAVAGGDIVYSKNSSWGNMAIVTTKHKGATWSHLYAHMNDADWNKYKQYHATKGYKVARGEIIGGVGSTGASSGPHLHLEVILSGTVNGKKYNNDVVEPMSLSEGTILVRGKKSGNPTGAVDKTSCICNENGGEKCEYHNKWDPATKALEVEKYKGKSCKGFNSKDPATSYKKGSKLPNGGVATPGNSAEAITTAYIGNNKGYNFENLHYNDGPIIKDVKYSGPTDIMPKSVANSLLNSIRVITDIVSENMVLGRMISCYATVENAGAFVKRILFKKTVLTDIITWIQGWVIFFISVMLVVAIGYYFLDISFKIGFCVLALPITAGLWPFKKTEGKIKVVISILFKASAIFAFMALISSYGISLISESLNDVDDLFLKIETASRGISSDENDQLNQYIRDTVHIFSTTFLMMVFSMYYFFKLVRKTIDTIVNKFFPDNVFGDASPMHQYATKTTERAINYTKQATGFNLAKDIVSHQGGRAVRSLVGKAGGAVGSRAGSLVSKGANKIVGAFKGKKSGSSTSGSSGSEGGN